jgi:acetyltransferase
MAGESSPSTSFDPAHDIWRVSQHPLRPFFAPTTVALIGATDRPGSVGRAILRNLIATPFGGTVLPVNPKRASVMGIKAYARIADLPEPAELAVLVTPASSIPEIIQECGEAGTRCAIVISAGFKEIGPTGLALEQRLLALARRYRMRVIGPNCLGVMCPPSGINATFAHAMARSGSVAFISQSGALCTGVLDWSLQEHVGFSAFISIGSMLDVGWGDLIDYFGDDPKTRSIVLYMESIGEARSFLSAAREVALSKPIIVIKSGRTDAAARAAASHTGTLAGSDDAMEAAFRRVGVLRVDTIEDLFAMADVLGKQPRPIGRRLTILTNAGGPGVLATDALIRGGGELTPLGETTVQSLNNLLPAQWSRANPIDILGDADPARYSAACRAAMEDPAGDGLLVILTPQAMTDPTRTAVELCTAVAGWKKPVLASWMGGAEVAAGARYLSEHGIPNFPYPDIAARIFNFMGRYSYNLRGIYETPSLPTGPGATQQESRRVAELLQQAQRQDRTLLTEAQAKEVLAAYGIPVTPTQTAPTAQAAAAVADQMGYPVVLKLLSRTISHKTDVGGVRLNLQTPEEVRGAFDLIRQSVEEKAGPGHFDGVTVQPMISLDGYEIILGSTVDPQLGPVVLFGAGGQLVEVMKDRALGLPPMTSTLARRMMEQTRIFSAFGGVRGRRPIALAELERLIVRFSRLIVEHLWIKEIDINPLLVSPERMVALDARVVLHPKATPVECLPRPAIRPYPAQYVTRLKTRDGVELTARPIRPEDEPLLVEFHRRLSDRTVHQRFLGMLQYDTRVMHERLIRRCFNDYDREIALVAECSQRAASIVGVGRLSRTPGTQEARFAIIIADAFQNRGVGAQLLAFLLAVARQEKISRLRAEILASNYPMQHLCRQAGFEVSQPANGNLVDATIDL